jgi:signal transduction histidine kinase
VLGELLHSLSQPLTGLRCSLELSLQLPLDRSIEEVTEQQQASVSAALQQTEKVIGMIQLMREYLDAEQTAAQAFSSALAPAMRSVIEELSSIAAVRGVRLRLVGTCMATLPVPESRLRLALQYLITTLIEAQPVGGKVMLLLGEGPAGAVLRAEGERGFHQQKPSATNPQKSLRRARIAIASRVLESAGASLVFGGGDVDATGFVLRIPRRVASPAR